MNITRLLTSRKLWTLGFLLIILIFLATFPVYGSNSDTSFLTVILMYTILTVSWVMFSGSTGYMSLAVAAFFGIGQYTAAFLYPRGGPLVPLPVVIIAGGIVSFVIALLIGMVTLRLKGMYFAIFTFGFVVLLREIFVYYELDIVGVRGQRLTQITTETAFYIILGILVVALITAYLIRRSRLGLAMQYIGGNEDAAAHMGVNTTTVKILTFAVSAIFMGAAGAIMAPKWVYVDPTVSFNVFYSFMPVLMAVFGGMGRLYGPVIGAAIFAYTERALRLQYPYYYMLAFGIILILVILYMPGGLVGLIQKLQKSGLISKLLNRGKEKQHANT